MWARDSVPSRAGADWILKVDGSAGTEWEAQLAPAEVGSAGVLVGSAGVHPTVRLCWSDGWPAHPAVRCLAARTGRAGARVRPLRDCLSQGTEC